MLELIEQGRSTEASQLLHQLAEEDLARSRKRAAQRYRDSGRIAFLNDTKASMADYTRATELDPDDPDGWNQLGALQRRTGGGVAAATPSFERVLAIGNKVGRKDIQAVATNNLGTIYMKHGEFDRAEAMFKRDFELSEQLASIEGQARATSNLGVIYLTRDQLDRGAAMFMRALELAEILGDKEKQAAITGNLGRIYQTSGQLDLAEAMFKRTLELTEVLRIIEQQAISFGNLALQLHF